MRIQLLNRRIWGGPRGGASHAAGARDGEGEIELTDREIDQLVYELYGLTEEERKIVEGE